jgi:protein-tyrosine phosphatase
MHPDTAMVLRGFGAEAGDFRARQLHGVLVSNADLTLTMTRDHRRAVLEQAPGALASTFTVREAAALMAGIGGEAQFPGPTFQYRARAFVGALAGQRARRGADREDDVPDPIGQPVAFQQDVGEMIVAALLPILGRLAGLAAPAPGTSHDAPAG